MAVPVINGTIVSVESTSTISFTVGNNSDRLLIVTIGTHQSSSASGVTYNGDAMTLLHREAGSFGEHVDIWGLIAPDVGTANVVISGQNNFYGVGIYDISGADQTELPQVTAGDSGGNNYAYVEITTPEDDCLVVAVESSEPVPEVDTDIPGLTEDWYQQGASYQNAMGAHVERATAGIQEIGFGLNYGARWQVAAVAIKSAGVSFTTTTQTVTAKANIQLPLSGTTQTVSAKGRIEKQRTETVTAKARIEKQRTQTISAKGNITDLIQKTKTVSARGYIVVGRLFEDGFESGNTAQWSAVEGTVTVDTSKLIEGAYTAHMNSATADQSVRFNMTTDMHRIRTRMYFDTSALTFSEDAGTRIILLRDSNWDYIANVELDPFGDTWKVRLQLDTDTGTVETQYYEIPDGMNFVEIDVFISTTASPSIGFGTLWVNGELKEILSNVDNDGFAQFSHLDFGIRDVWGTSRSGNFYIDAIAIDDINYIGPLATFKQITAKARIATLETQTVNAKGRIERSRTEIIQAKARIQILGSPTIIAKGNIVEWGGWSEDWQFGVPDFITHTQTITAKGNIFATSQKSLTAKARIERQESATIQAKGRIEISSEQSITAKARINVLETRTVTARGRIEIASTQTITAKGSIQKTTQRSVTSKARIIRLVTLSRMAASNVGMNYYHESMGYVGRTDEQIETDLDRISPLTKKIKIYHNPYTNAGAVTAEVSIAIIRRIVEIAKIKGFYIVWTENNDSVTLTDANWSDYSNKVIADAAIAQEIGVDEFLVGNEISIHNNGDTGFLDANLPARIKQLVTDCDTNFPGTKGVQEGWWKNQNWNSAGLGSLDKIYFTLYEQWHNYKDQFDTTVSLFPTGAEIGEISTTTTKSALNVSDEEWAIQLMRRYDYARQKGLFVWLFTYKEATDNSFGYFNNDETVREPYIYAKGLRTHRYNVYLQESFVSGIGAFQESGGVWNENGQLRVEQFNSAIAGWSSDSDYVFRGEITLISELSSDSWVAARPVVRYQDADNYYFVNIAPNGGTAGIVQLFRRVAGSESWLAETQIPLNLSEKYSFEIRIQGQNAATRIQVYLKDIKVIDVVDSGNSTLNSGKFGFRNNGVSTEADDIIVTSIEEVVNLGAHIDAKASISKRRTESISSKARIKKIESKSITARGRIERHNTKTITAKARIEIFSQRTITAKGRIEISSTQTIASKGRIEKLRTETITAKGDIHKLQTQTVNAKALLLTTGNARNISAKANIKATITQDINAKGAIQRSFEKTISAKARIMILSDQTVDAKANIKVATTQSINALGRIEQRRSHTLSAKGRIEIQSAKNISAKGRIEILTSQSVEAKGRITITSTQDVTAKGRITITNDRNLDAKGNIRATQTKTVQAKARIGGGRDKFISAKASIKKQATRTLNAKAAIQREFTVSINAKARIEILSTRILTAKGRIEIFTTQNVTAKARIERQRTESISAKADIFKVQTKTVNAKGRIEIFTTQTIQARGDIVKLITENISAKARIEQLRVKTVNAKANIKVTQTKTLEAVGRIEKQFEYTVNAKARIEVGRTKTITAKGNIFKTNVQTISAKGKIEEAHKQTIEAKAKIIIVYTETISAKAHIAKIGIVEIIDVIRTQNLVKEITYPKTRVAEVNIPRRQRIKWVTARAKIVI